jgi:hypothetical protein
MLLQNKHAREDRSQAGKQVRTPSNGGVARPNPTRNRALRSAQARGAETDQSGSQGFTTRRIFALGRTVAAIAHRIGAQVCSRMALPISAMMGQDTKSCLLFLYSVACTATLAGTMMDSIRFLCLFFPFYPFYFFSFSVLPLYFLQLIISSSNPYKLFIFSL